MGEWLSGSVAQWVAQWMWWWWWWWCFGGRGGGAARGVLGGGSGAVTGTGALVVRGDLGFNVFVRDAHTSGPLVQHVDGHREAALTLRTVFDAARHFACQVVCFIAHLCLVGGPRWQRYLEYRARVRFS